MALFTRCEILGLRKEITNFKKGKRPPSLYFTVSPIAELRLSIPLIQAPHPLQTKDSSQTKGCHKGAHSFLGGKSPVFAFPG